MPGFEPKFGYAVDEFQRYRPDYPQAVYDLVLACVPEHGRSLAMDLGAGTGRVTAHLVSYFREVISVEPDHAMAAKIAERVPQARIRKVTAEECVQPAESVDLITISNALHWMDSERVLANARRWLRSTGVLAVFGGSFPKTDIEAVHAIVLAELHGTWKPYRDVRLKRDFVWEEQVRGALGFVLIQEAKFPHIVPMSAHDYVGFWRSTSYGSAYARTLAAPENYWREFESRFAAAAAGAIIPVDLSPTVIVAHKA